jgi:hypothetical protein
MQYRIECEFYNYCRFLIYCIVKKRVVNITNIETQTYTILYDWCWVSIDVILTWCSSFEYGYSNPENEFINVYIYTYS